MSQRADSVGLEVRLAGHRFLLDPSGAVVDVAARRGFVADLHLGKGAVFRRAGIAIPTGDSQLTLDLVAQLVERHALESLWILGDLIHGAASWTPELSAAGARWRADHASLDVVLVPGNHDRGSGPLPQAWRIRTVAPGTRIGPVGVRHEPEQGEPGPVLAGHLHPVVRLREGRSGGLRPRCFWWSGGTLVLPAFGPFTGGHPVRPLAGDRVFAAGPDAVIEIPVAPSL